MVRTGAEVGRTRELIFLDPDDDLGTVRAKLESSPADEIFLVIPRGATALRTPLEFRILARLAHDLSTSVVVVSADAGRRMLARQEGLRARRGYRSLHKPADASPAATWLAAAADWLPLPSLATVVVLVMLALVIGGLLFVTLPVMYVAVTPAAENVHREIELIVDPTQRTADPSRGLLPGEVMQYRFEVSGSVPATGEKTVGRDPARGEVILSNASGNTIVLPAKTAIVARNGIRFLTDTEVQVRPFSFNVTRVGVTAEQKGTVGNIGANQVVTVDPPIPQLSVRNDRPMTGGTDRQVKAVTAADQAKLKEQLLQRARDRAMAEFSARGGQAKSVPPNTLQLRIESESYQPQVDGEGDQMTGTATVSASVVAWDNQGLNALVQRMLLANFGPDYELPLEQLRLQPPEVVETQGQRMRLHIKADALVTRIVDAAAIASELRGRSGAEARALLQRDASLAAVPRLDIQPGWAPRAFRVEVTVVPPK